MIKVTWALDRRRIAAGADAHCHLLLRLSSEGGSGQRHPLDLVLLIDRSSSMRGTPLACAIEAALLVAARLDDRDSLAVVVFDRDVRPLWGPAPVTAEGRLRLGDRLDNVMTGYLTNLGGALVEGCRLAGATLRPGAVCRVVLLTDGLPSYGVIDRAEIAEMASFWQAKGVAISTVGLGGAFDEGLLADVATRGGGTFRYARRSEDLPGALAAELGDLFAVAFRQATVRVTMAKPVAGVEVLHGYPARRTGQEIAIEIGEVFAGAPRALLLSFLVPAAEARPGPLLLGTALVEAADPAGAEVRERLEALVEVARVGEAVPEAIEAEVGVEIALLRAGRLEQSALERADVGDYVAARRLLDRARAELRQATGGAGGGEVRLRRMIEEIDEAARRMAPGLYGPEARKHLFTTSWGSVVCKVPQPAGAADPPASGGSDEDGGEGEGEDEDGDA